MTDVNEEIIAQYLKLIKKWFYITDISFKVPKNYSNIDLLAFDPINNRFYDIEVKFRSQFTIAANSKKGNDSSKENIRKFLKQLIDYPARDKKIKEFIKSRKAIKVLVTTKQLIGKTETKRKQLENSFKNLMKEYGYRKCEIWYFDDIIPDLFKSVNTKGRYNSELIQAIRMIKIYNE